MQVVQTLIQTEFAETEDSGDDLYLTFTIGNETYGISIGYVKEIIGIQPITIIPESPPHIKGVINLRGDIIPVMDVRARFQRSEVPYDSRTCIIVADIRDISIGLIVDRVAEVMAIPAENVSKPQGIGNRGGYLKGFGKVGNEIKLLIDCEVLLRDDAALLRKNEALKGLER